MKKIFAISDIHGCDHLLTKLLKIIDWDKEKNNNSKLIFLGDYVDKGTDSVKTLKHIKSLKEDSPQNVIILLGNHDFAWLEQAKYYNSMSFYSKILKSPFIKFKQVLNCLDDTAYYYIDTMSDKTIYFVHAGFELDKPLSEQSEDALLWLREEFFCNNNLIHEDFKDSIIVFGHTPTPFMEEDILSASKVKHLDNSKVLMIDNFKIDIDTGAFFTGELSALEIIENNGLSFKVYSTI